MGSFHLLNKDAHLAPCSTVEAGSLISSILMMREEEEQQLTSEFSRVERLQKNLGKEIDWAWKTKM